MAERDPFAALADPTRRQIVELLVDGGPTTATSLAGGLDISRQAVAKHLQLLADAGLASSERVGRETRFQATLSGLDDVRRWMERVESEWTGRLARLAAAVEDAADGGTDPA
ncbi:MAG: metalloregulator ArsR/SmtB family transcription factor [Actinomycetota bacterium]